MYLSRVLDRKLLNGWRHRHENCRLCSRPHSHESLMLSYFWDSYFLNYGEFGELIMKLRVQLCGRRLSLASAEPGHWSEGRGVSLQEKQATMRVMLGVSLRARWTQL